MKLLPAAQGKKVMLEFKADPGCQVFVAGTFNDWNPTSHPLKDNPDSGHFKAVLRLPRGRCEYKFIVNGVWCEDPRCPESVPNACGTRNSVMQV